MYMQFENYIFTVACVCSSSAAAAACIYAYVNVCLCFHSFCLQRAGQKKNIMKKLKKKNMKMKYRTKNAMAKEIG